MAVCMSVLLYSRMAVLPGGIGIKNSVFSLGSRNRWAVFMTHLAHRIGAGLRGSCHYLRDDSPLEFAGLVCHLRRSRDGDLSCLDRPDHFGCRLLSNFDPVTPEPVGDVQKFCGFWLR